MKLKLTFAACFLVLIVAGCAPKSHFGVTNKALTAPPEFEQTELAIAKAEQSEGAKYCPEKISQAKALGREAVEAFWACRTGEAMGMLSRAGQLAEDAELCQPPEETPPPPPPEPEPEPALPTSLPSGYFEFDESTLLPEAQAKLDDVAVFMKDNPHVKVVIEGHTDAIGTEKYNMALGQRRAQSAEDYLEAKGISSSRISTVSYGETRPVASNATREGRAKNRRVDLFPMK
ncbi:MAG: OmpA family protein [Desulfatiglandaceae bacterium]